MGKLIMFFKFKLTHIFRKMNQKSYFTWTEDQKYTLAKLALRHEGYKLTDRNHQEKWEIISSNKLNLNLWNVARDGKNDAVLAAIADGGDVNWKNYSNVSDNDI
jgi:hypothetical protein